MAMAMRDSDLSFQRLARLGNEARVLYCDEGLRCEVLE